MVFECGAVGNVGVVEEGLCQGFAVEGYGLDVFVVFGEVADTDFDLFAVGKVDCRMRKPGSADGVSGFAGAYLIEAEGVHDIPCRHLSAVFVARQAVDIGAILFAEYAVGEFLGAVWPAYIIIKVYDVV